MKKTLYLLRKPIEQIHPAIFHPGDSKGDIVLLEGAGGAVFSYTGGSVFSLSDRQTDHSLTYDGLVEKIFACDHTMVI
jgi:hypothetical protein